MSFIGKQKTCTYKQLNHGSLDEVFPLLCPVRETDWLDGWDYTMVHSDSGFIEQNCVFTTPHHGESDTVWHVTQYDRESCRIEFLRVTPTENVVRINIELEELDSTETRTHITYQYTALNKEQNRFIEDDLERSFLDSMMWWEKAINHYLKTGNMLKK